MLFYLMIVRFSLYDCTYIQKLEWGETVKLEISSTLQKKHFYDDLWRSKRRRDHRVNDQSFWWSVDRIICKKFQFFSIRFGTQKKCCTRLPWIKFNRLDDDDDWRFFFCGFCAAAWWSNLRFDTFFCVLLVISNTRYPQFDQILSIVIAYLIWV